MKTEPEPTVAEARAFAINEHRDQQYGDKPYVVHLDAVARRLAPYGEKAQIAGYLHDTIEDTERSRDLVRHEIDAKFGTFLREVTDAISDEEGATRRERKIKTYAKLAALPERLYLTLIVKAADRLCNISACVAENKPTLFDMYQAEHAELKAAAYRTGLCDELWAEMEAILSTGLTTDPHIPKKIPGQPVI